MSSKFIQLIESIKTYIEYNSSFQRPITKRQILLAIQTKLADSFYRFREVWVESPKLEFHVEENLHPITTWGQLWTSETFGCRAYFRIAFDYFAIDHPDYKGFKLYTEFKKEVSTSEYLDWMQFCRDCKVAPDNTWVHRIDPSSILQFRQVNEGYLDLVTKIIGKIKDRIEKIDESQKLTKMVIFDVMKSILIKHENQIKERVVPETTKTRYLNSMWSPKQHGVPAVFFEEQNAFVVEI